MKIAIHPDKVKIGSYLESWSAKWCELLKNRNIDTKLVNPFNDESWIEQVSECDGFMWRTTHSSNQKQVAKKVLNIIKKYINIPVYPNHETYWHYDEKVIQSYIFRSLNIDTPDTWIFWNKDCAINWAKRTTYPKIFKLSGGASSENVKIVNSYKEAIDLTNRMFCAGIYSDDLLNKYNTISPVYKNMSLDLLYRIKKSLELICLRKYPDMHKGSKWIQEKNYSYFQEFIPKNDYDTRVVTIGDRIWGFRRFNRPNDFRASGSGHFDLDPSKVNKECLKIAYKLSSKLGCQSMAYDFLFKNNKPVLTEMSYTFVDHVIAKCPGYWTPNLIWIDGHIWPQEAVLDDFLNCIKKSKRKL